MVRAQRHRRWCFTLNHYSEDEIGSLDNLTCKYLIYGKEVGESGTPHLQGFLIFEDLVSLAKCKERIPRAHLEPAKGSSEQASDYCKKDGDFVERGVLNQSGKRTDLQRVVELVKKGQSFNDIVQEHGDVFVKFARGLNALSMVLQKPYNHDGERGLWLVGKPRTGKSRFARTYQNYFVKAQNKWWDGYDGEHVVILDDLDDKGGQMLGHYLKIWTDRYACRGETKGGTVNLQHRLFIITSNFTLRDLFGESNQMYTALRSRFVVMDFDLFPYRPVDEEVRYAGTGYVADMLTRHATPDFAAPLEDPNVSVEDKYDTYFSELT